MELKEFRERIDRAESDLIIGYETTGVCEALDLTLSRSFIKAFKPAFFEWDLDHVYFGYWIGPLTKELIPDRLLFLRMFERVAIDGGWYEEY